MTKSLLRRVPLGLTPLVLCVVLWQLFGSPDSVIYPRPGDWLAELYRLNDDGDLLPALAGTLRAFAIGLVIAGVVGLVGGILLGGTPFMETILSIEIEFLRVLPSPVIIPFVVLAMGYNMTMKITVASLAAVWPILLGVAAARRSLSGALADLGGSLRLGTVRRFMAISLPSVMPAFIVGLRVAAPVTLVVTLLVELLTGVPGLGHLIALAQASFNAALTFGLVALAGVLGWLVNNLAAKAEHRLLRRHGLNRHADAAM
ncbi:MAG: hypothetical protein QOE19_2564 [Actinomycetota bacterium]|jgi:NitT/TauT family transport system permease protein|nr:hypothetical protein [Actinomycetota bacterium]